MHILSCVELIILNMEDISISHDCIVEGCDVGLLLQAQLSSDGTFASICSANSVSVHTTHQNCRQHAWHLMNESEVRL